MVGGVGEEFVGGADDVVAVVYQVDLVKALYGLYLVRFGVRFIFFGIV